MGYNVHSMRIITEIGEVLAKGAAVRDLIDQFCVLLALVPCYEISVQWNCEESPALSDQSAANIAASYLPSRL